MAPFHRFGVRELLITGQRRIRKDSSGSALVNVACHTPYGIVLIGLSAFPEQEKCVDTAGPGAGI